jgi:hypothetical protein
VDIVWDGITKPDTLSASAVRVRNNLADAAKLYDWQRMFEVLLEHEQLVNTTRPGGESWFAPLHQAAHGGATIEVAERLVGTGAWRTLQNARGERPIDVAVRTGHRHLLVVCHS